VPIEPEHASQGLEPERIGKTSQHFGRTATRDDMNRDFPREARHAAEEPCRGASAVERKVGETGSTGHVIAYVFWSLRKS
jgi:hypothetical protein